MPPLKRSQSERLYPRRGCSTFTEADTNYDQWRGVKQAWHQDEDKGKDINREQRRKTLLRRIVSSILKALRLRRKRRIINVSIEDLVKDIHQAESMEERHQLEILEEIHKHESEEGSSDGSAFYSASSNMMLEENAALKREIKAKDNEIESLHQRVKELEGGCNVRSTTNRGGFVFNEPTCVNIHFGEGTIPSNNFEE